MSDLRVDYVPLHSFDLLASDCPCQWFHSFLRSNLRSSLAKSLPLSWCFMKSAQAHVIYVVVSPADFDIYFYFILPILVISPHAMFSFRSGTRFSPPW